MDKWMNKLHIYLYTLFTLKKKGDPGICNNMDETYAKRNEPDIERKKNCMSSLICVILKNQMHGSKE